MNTLNLRYANGVHQRAHAQTLPFLSPTVKNGIIVPGLPTLPPGVERYIVNGGGSVTVKVEQGDKITLVDKDGLQAAELVLFDDNGSSKAAYLGQAGGQPAQGLKQILSGTSTSAKRLHRSLSKHGIDIVNAEAVYIANTHSLPGEQQRFSAQVSGTLVVAAPGLWMHKIRSRILFYLLNASIRRPNVLLVLLNRWLIRYRMLISSRGKPVLISSKKGSTSRLWIFRGASVRIFRPLICVP